jgi:GNAT superfamily N-acetyltransferase
VERIGSERAGTFASVVAKAFGFPPMLEPYAACVVGRPSWHHYLAYDGDHAIGCAAMFLPGEAAWFGFAATLEEARGQGAQSALIVRRLADAAREGCKWVSVETAEQTEDHEAPSYRNLMRLGFSVAYKRPNYLWTRV